MTTATDIIAPTVTSIDYSNSINSTTNADSLTYRVTFSEAVLNVNKTDFTVTGSTATITKVSAVSGTTAYDVTISGGNLSSYNGSVTLGFNTSSNGGEDEGESNLSQNITDKAHNQLTNITPSGTNHVTYTVDNTAPTVTINHLPGAANFDQGFSVTSGAVVSLTDGLLTNFTKSTANGIDSYSANANAFTGTEANHVKVNASLTDLAGNIGSANLTLAAIDTTAPIVIINHLPGAANFDQGFSVTSGAVVSLTDSLLTNFTKSTANGIDNYSANANAFTGTEVNHVKVNASLTDLAGNTGLATQLTLANIDTTITPPTILQSGAAHVDHLGHVLVDLTLDDKNTDLNPLLTTVTVTDGTKSINATLSGSLKWPPLSRQIML